jgi:parallel beta-helix repeat protein
MCKITLLCFLCLTLLRGILFYSSSSSIPLHTSLTLTKNPVIIHPIVPSKIKLSPFDTPTPSSSLNFTFQTPINISSDGELAAVANKGDGTETAPYILEGWNISAVGIPGIFIRGTTENFIIQNNWITGDGINKGIYIQNIASGTTTISNNVLVENEAGIFILGSNKVVVENNTCQNNTRGISIYGGENSTVINNTCIQNTDYGIELVGSALSTVIENRCQNNAHGLNIDNSDSTTVINNTCQNNDIGISSINSNNVSITGNWLLENQGRGIVVLSADFATITNNTCINNRWGIYLVSSGFVLICNNTCIQSTEHGFVLEYSSNCLITGNSLIENQRYGIVLYVSGFNRLFHNMFLSNNNGSTQAYDEKAEANWYDAITKEGNYWDDYTGTGKYVLAPSTGAIDPYPLNEKLESSDSDDDGLPDWWEVQMGLNPLVDDAQEDFDNDNLSNLEEYLQGTDPHSSDSDMDGLTDGDEVKIYTTNPLNPDSDMDGLPDRWEVTMGTNPLINDTKVDLDYDGLVNLEEYNKGTDPTVADSDADGLSDGDEVKKYNTDPLDSDSDNDLFPDGLDYGWWGNPRNRWDNPLIRSILLLLMIGLVGLGLWASFIAVQLPRLKRDLSLLYQHFQQYVQQFQESITVMKTLESFEELEIVSEHIDITFQSYEEFFSFAQHLVKPKWLPAFLRPKLTQWETTFAILQQAYEKFQQTRLKRLEAKY